MKGLLYLLLAGCHGVSAGVTLYNGDQFEQQTATASATEVEAAQYTGLPAYDPLRLDPPQPPAEAVTQVEIAIPADPVGAGYRLSKQQKGNFLGFSIEL